MLHRIGLAFGVLALTLTACGEAPSSPPRCATRCPEGLVCDEARGTCVPGTGQKVPCETDGQCAAPADRCHPLDAVCVECVSGEHCPSGACFDGLCVPAPERCELAQKVFLGGGTVIIEGSTQGRAHDTQTSCAAGEGAADLVYELVLETPARVNAWATPASGSALRPVLELRSACASTAAKDLAACAWSRGGQGAHLSVELPAGSHFLWLDADAGTQGAFVLELFTTEAAAGESCLFPKTLSLEVDEHLVKGSTAGLNDDLQGLCGGEGPDEVWWLDVPAPSRVQVDVTPVLPWRQVVLYLRRPGGCAGPAGSQELECHRASVGGVASLDLPRLEPGRYALVVDAEQAGTDYTLLVRQAPPLEPPSNDHCGGVMPLQLPEEGAVSWQVDTTTAHSDAAAACGGAGADVVYSFTLSSPRQVTLRATPLPLDSQVVPALYLRRSCASDAAADLRACTHARKPGGRAEWVQGALEAGTWYLWVDASTREKGPLSLEIETAPPAPPPVHDGCAAPEVLDLSTGEAEVAGSTHFATDDVSRCQAPTGAPSADVAYTFTLKDLAAVTVDAQAASDSALRPAISLERGTCGQGASATRACAVPAPGSFRVARTFGALQPGTYFLWVDGHLATAGDFTLRAFTRPPAPAPPNDTCAAATVLSPYKAAVTGDTRSATDRAAGHCAAVPGSSGEGAPDVVFAFETDTPRAVKITITPDAVDGAHFIPAAYLRGPGLAACSAQQAGSQVTCGVSGGYGQPLSLEVSTLPAGVWHLWVDGSSGTSGKFDVTLEYP